MSAPAGFYIGHVGHERFGGVTHRLRYAIAYVLVDLDRMAEADRLSPLLGVGRGGPMAVLPRDHGPGDADDLAGWARGVLRDHGVDAPATRITLLTLPRMFGYVFNPLSVYFVYGPDDALHHVLYEVGNTFGERHFYLCPADGGGATIDHTCAKAFYVSPFFDVAGTYRFRVHVPEARMAVAIRYDDAEGQPALSASLEGTRAPITTASCLSVLCRFPLMTLGVIAGIHWEAIKLMLKGARYRPHGPKKTRAELTRGEPATHARLSDADRKSAA